jgi:hypothetical protein
MLPTPDMPLRANKPHMHGHLSLVSTGFLPDVPPTQRKAPQRSHL